MKQKVEEVESTRIFLGSVLLHVYFKREQEDLESD